MERKKTNEIYVRPFDSATQKGNSTATRGVSFLWDDVVNLKESTFFTNCTIIKTVHEEFTINEQFDLVDGEWNAFLEREKLGITKQNE